MTTAERIRKAVGAIGNVDAATLDEAETAIAAIVAAAVTEALPRWVPVGERLPEVDDSVLVTYLQGMSGTPTVCEAAFRGQWDPDDPPSWDSLGWPIQDVLAWQPLPAPWVELSKKEGE